MRLNRYSLPALAATLALALPAQAQYDSGAEATVPYVASGTITLDGDASEAAWDDALEVDLTANWDPFGVPEPDVAVFGKLLYTEGALYVSAVFEDYQAFYWGEPGQGWQGEQVLVGVDLTGQGGDPDGDFAGWTFNMPDAGPVAYKVSGPLGITANWGFDGISPVDSGWVDGEVFVDDGTFTWGFEMAIYGDEIAPGAEIGFNIGGATASQEWADDNEGEGTYGYFAWQVCQNPTAETFCQYPGGNVMADAASFALLTLDDGTAGDGGPAAAAAALSAYPNPSRGAVEAAYTLDRPGTVELAAYDVLGRRVAVLDAGTRAAGTHPVAVDVALPAGVYLLRLTVDGKALVQPAEIRLD